MEFQCQEFIAVYRQVPKTDANDKLAPAIRDALDSMDDERESYVLWDSIALEDEDCGIELSYAGRDEDGPSETTFTVIAGYIYEEANYQFGEGAKGLLKGKMIPALSVYEDKPCVCATDKDGNDVEFECLDSSEASDTFVWVYLGDELIDRYSVEEVEDWDEVVKELLE